MTDDARTEATATTGRRLPLWVPPLLDMAVIVVFVLLGRRNHDEGESVAGFLRVWWPFAAGLGLSAVAFGAWWYPFAWRRVVGAWLGTVVIGMALRISLQGRALKPAFVVVATLFIGAGMLGWRAVARWWLARRHRSGSAGV